MQAIWECPKILWNFTRQSRKSTRKKNKNFLKKRFKDQIEKILPSDGSNATDTELWDINIIVFFIKHGTTLPAPCGTWRTPKQCNCPHHKIPYYSWRIKEIRNKFAHPNSKNFDEKEFNTLWNEMALIASGLPNNARLMKELKYIKELSKEDIEDKEWQKKMIDQLECNTIRLDIMETRRKREWLCKIYLFYQSQNHRFPINWKSY